MIVVTIAGPFFYFRRIGFQRLSLMFVGVILLVGASGLYEGLLLLSIQEVGGTMFVSIGLAINRPGWRWVFFLLAALFKAPFAWILVGYSVYLFRTGERRKAWYNAGSAAAVLIIGVALSRSGSYTQRYRLDPLDPELWKSAAQILDPVNAALLAAVLWWLVATKSRLVRRSEFPIFAVGFAGYYIQMIPWGFTAYYMGPISFLLGLLLLSVIAPKSGASKAEMLVGLLLPVVIAISVLRGSFEFVMRTNGIISDSTQCLVQAKAERTSIEGSWLYLTTSPEGPIRLTQNIKYFFDDWSGQAALSGEISDPTHVLLVNQSDGLRNIGGVEVCKRDLVSVIQLRK
jgi:hypothetical protein